MRDCGFHLFKYLLFAVMLFSFLFSRFYKPFHLFLPVKKLLTFKLKLLITETKQIAAYCIFRKKNLGKASEV